MQDERAAEQEMISVDEGALPQPVLPQLAEVWKQLGWQPNSVQQGQFQRFYELILQGNQQLNLTRITEPEEFWEKHLWDSLRGVAPLFRVEAGEKDSSAPQPATAFAAHHAADVLLSHRSQQPPCLPSSFQVIDIGTGGGIPGIPVAIAQPDWTVTLLDSTRKKVAWLDTLLPSLDIGNVKTLIGRAEQVGQNSQHRQVYDLALVRAVASASVCAEYALPLLKVGGVAVLYRGQWTEAEAIALQSAAAQLGGKVESIEEFVTPLSQSIRHCLYLSKVASTQARFPRPVGVPAQKPL
jgi:16S rRNA (guanine527-N7)-methyltransferase